MKLLKQYNIPMVYFEPEHLAQVFHLASLHKTEVAWLSTIIATDEAIIIYGDVHIPEQKVASATVEVDNWGQLINELPDDVEVSTLRGWGHSHNTMGVTPSSQDRQHGQEFYDNFGHGGGWFASYIVNYKEEIHVDLYDWTNGVMHENVNYAIDWGLSGDAEKRINKLSEERVSKLHQPAVCQGQSFNRKHVRGNLPSCPTLPQYNQTSIIDYGGGAPSHFDLDEDDIPEDPTLTQQFKILREAGYAAINEVWYPTDGVKDETIVEVECLLDFWGWCEVEEEGWMPVCY